MRGEQSRGAAMKKYHVDMEPADCEWCAKPLPIVRHWRTLFCNKDCGNAYFNKLAADAAAEDRSRLKCEACGNPIKGAKRAHQRYCGRRCWPSKKRKIAPD
jgi:hypothetical protein